MVGLTSSRMAKSQKKPGAGVRHRPLRRILAIAIMGRAGSGKKYRGGAPVLPAWKLDRALGGFVVILSTGLGM